MQPHTGVQVRGIRSKSCLKFSSNLGHRSQASVCKLHHELCVILPRVRQPCNSNILVTHGFHFENAHLLSNVVKDKEQVF